MTGVAELPAGMLFGVDLREALRFGDVLGMAADTQMGDVGLLGCHARGIFGVLRERAMTGLTVDVGVNAFGFYVGLVGVTAIASLVARVGDWTRGDFCDGVTPEVAVAPEALRNEGTAEDKEKDQADEENGGHAKEMGNVLQLGHDVACSAAKKSVERSFL